MAADETLDKEYLLQDGMAALWEAAVRLVLGSGSRALVQNRVRGREGRGGKGRDFFGTSSSCSLITRAESGLVCCLHCCVCARCGVVCCLHCCVCARCGVVCCLHCCVCVGWYCRDSLLHCDNWRIDLDGHITHSRMKQ